MVNDKGGVQMSSMNTPFDDAFHTLLTDCRKLIIPIVNEVFHTHYNENCEKPCGQV